MAPVLAILLLLGGCRSTGPDVPVPGVPVPNAPVIQPPMSPDPEVPIYKNTIKWTTASEVDNFGFDVYRGLSAEGPFERLNEETIEGAGTTDEPQKYRFVDDTLDPHRTYYYFVESISMSGDRKKFTPVGKASPKIKPTGTGEPE